MKKMSFVDESGIDQYLHREHCQALKGEQVYEAVPGWKFERCSIVAGKCGKEVIAPFGYTETCDSGLFLKWVKNQIVIMDNAAIHKSPEIRKVIEKAGCRLIFSIHICQILIQSNIFGTT